MAKRRVAVVALLLCLCLSWLPNYTQAASTADAREPISPDKECSLTIAYRYDEKSFSDLPVKLYKIADVSADFQYSLTAPFANSGLLLNGVRSVGEWNVIRSTLETHILAYGVAADLTAVTNQDGQVCFQGLKPGLYLAITEQILQNDWIYGFASALVALPGLGADGLWQYAVTVTAKAEAIPPAETDEEIALKVLKLWKGDSGRTDRPQSVEVEIFRNGASYQTVILSEENHWAYSWTAKDDGSVWKVIERKIPAGYTMTIDRVVNSNMSLPSVGEYGLEIFTDYGKVLLLLVGCMLAVALIVDPLVVAITLKKNPYPLVFKCFKESGITAFFTRSSAANIPVNMKLCEKLGLNKDYYSVAIPLGATINMDGAAITITVLSLSAAFSQGIEVNIVIPINQTLKFFQ